MLQMSEMRSSKSGDGPKKDMVAEYLKARVGKTPYEGPTGKENEGSKKDPEIKKESADKMCPMCGVKMKGEDCKKCQMAMKEMQKESAYLNRKAVNILKQALAPPPGAAGGAPEGGSPAGPGAPPMPEPEAGPPPGGGAPGGLLPLPLLLQQLQVYMQMAQSQGGEAPGGPPGGGAPGGPPGGPPPGAMPPGA
jgi:hypothetical protein